MNNLEQPPLPPEGDVVIVLNVEPAPPTSPTPRRSGHNSPKTKHMSHQLVPVHDTSERGQTIPGYSGKLGAPVKRNALCPCGSARKFKVCHGKRS